MAEPGVLVVTPSRPPINPTPPSQRSGSSTTQPKVSIPLSRTLLCLDCEACYPLSERVCPACTSRASVPLAQFFSRNRLALLLRAAQGAEPGGHDDADEQE